MKVPRGQREIWIFDPEEVDDAAEQKDAEPSVGPAAMLEASAALVRQVQEMRTQDQKSILCLLEAGIQDREASRNAAKDVLTMMSDTLKAKDEREKALQSSNDQLLEAARATARDSSEMRIAEMQAEQSEKRKNEAMSKLTDLAPTVAEGLVKWLANNPTLRDLAGNWIQRVDPTPAAGAVEAPPAPGAAEAPPAAAPDRKTILKAIARPGGIIGHLRMLEFIETLTAEEITGLLNTNQLGPEDVALVTELREKLEQSSASATQNSTGPVDLPPQTGVADRAARGPAET